MVISGTLNGFHFFGFSLMLNFDKIIGKLPSLPLEGNRVIKGHGAFMGALIFLRSLLNDLSNHCTNRKTEKSYWQIGHRTPILDLILIGVYVFESTCYNVTVSFYPKRNIKRTKISPRFCSSKTSNPF